MVSLIILTLRFYNSLNNCIYPCYIFIKIGVPKLSAKFRWNVCNQRNFNLFDTLALPSWKPSIHFVRYIFNLTSHKFTHKNGSQ